MPVKDRTGQRYGRLIAIERVSNDSFQRARWKCACDCTRTVIVIGNHLATGNTESCGCIKRELEPTIFRTHGQYGTPQHTSWQSAKQRCFNPNAPGFENYGGRGISMCDEWRDDFTAFLSYMGPRPSGSSLDRIDNNLGYQPGNCRWATPRQQLNNTRQNRVVTHKGERHTITEWSRLTGINVTTLRDRLKKNWPIEKVFTVRHRGEWNKKVT